MTKQYVITKQQLLSLASEMFQAGYNTSKYSPNPSFDKLKALKGSDFIISQFCSLPAERKLEIEKTKYLAEYINLVLDESGEKIK